MTNLVKRARDYARNLGGPPEDYLAWQLADEIERVQAALNTCRELREFDKIEIERLRALLESNK